MCVLDFDGRGRGGRARQRHRVRPFGRRLHRATSPAPTASSTGSRPAPAGSTPTISPRSRCRSAARSSPASGGRTRWPRSTTTPELKIASMWHGAGRGAVIAHGDRPLGDRSTPRWKPDFVIIGSGSRRLRPRLPPRRGRQALGAGAGISAARDWGPFIQMPAALAWPMSMKRYDWGFSPSPSRTSAAGASPARAAR